MIDVDVNNWPAMTALFTGPGRNSHQLMYIYIFLVNTENSYTINFQHLCFLKVQTPLTS